MSTPAHGPVYRARDFHVYLAVRLLANAGMLVQSVAVGWQVYEIERTPLVLGIVGLAEFVPMFLLTLPAGELADRFDPRRVLQASLLLDALCSGLLLIAALADARRIWAFYAVMVLFGCARGLSGPAVRTVLPLLLPPAQLPQALSWSSSVGQVAVIGAPALGGFLYALGAPVAYGLCLLAFALSALGTATLRGRAPVHDQELLAGRIERVREGIGFVRSRPVILGAISLDLFAVLLGGATALLPVYARDILRVGPGGLGVLRSAPAVGAAIMAISLARRPLSRDVGRTLFIGVGTFGVATIIFGLSRSFALSLLVLALAGAADQVSVYIRSALVQLATPDQMRGRVSAVSALFINASNELGAFESGVTAALIGTVPSVVLGGVGTLAIVVIWMRRFPALAHVNRLTDVMPDGVPRESA